MKLEPWKRRDLRTLAQGFGYFVGLLLTALLWSWFGQRRRGKRIPATADERTMRRIAEAQAGGMSSEEGRARYERGDHPGGLHGKAVRAPVDDDSFDDEEPSDRLEIHHGKRRAGMPAMRR